MPKSQPQGASPPPPPWSTPTATTPAPAQAPAEAPARHPGMQLPPDAPTTAGAPHGNIVLPNQAAPPPQLPPQPEPAPQPVPPGPWNDLACHRSWLMGARPAKRVTSQPQIDPRTRMLVPGTGNEEIIMVPVPSPYNCIGPKCTLWNAARGGCIEKIALELQAHRAELEIVQIRAFLAQQAQAQPQVSAPGVPG